MFTSCLSVRFYATQNGTEPVKVWLQTFDAQDRRAIGVDIKTIQLGWPLGMPLVRKIADGLWETRTHLHGRIARIFFTIVNQTIVLLHGFIKKSQSTPLKELAIATHRLKQIRNAL
ncbi:type II toxin-antitoxin system RelE/ParE family toxin [Pusillimonas sp. NJUB218]|uniref:type II toxin-antitoxin system RelE/ParE family toxin n=1 Tax=Pusillimonas sp. NJUB218 TaxID=2023230 RepID=UPI001F2203B4|nr:type II toxin-antitoxin system RelE/ParE family toxin [Pusillimonas sp. NJUB218]